MSNWINNMRMRVKLVTFMLLIGLIPLVVASAVSYFRAKSALDQSNVDKQRVVITSAANFMTNWTNERTQDVQTLATLSRIKSMEPESASAAIKDYYDLWGIYETIALLGLDGKSIATNDGSSLDLSARAYVQEALKGNTVVADAVVSKATGNVVMPFAAPVIAEGKQVGVILLVVPMTSISDSLAANLTEETDDIYLVNASGYLVTAPRFSDAMKTAGLYENRPELEYLLTSQAGQAIQTKSAGSGVYENYLGKEVTGMYGWIDVMHLGIVSEIQTSEANAASNQMLVTVGIVLAVAVVAVILIALYISNSITRPLSLIVKSGQLLAVGDLVRDMDQKEQEKVIKRKDELGDIGKAFAGIVNYMQDGALVAQSIAANDLTVSVTPKSAKDELGNAFSVMVNNLREAIGSVAKNVVSLTTASNELASAANQAGQATNQIATTVQQVAKGTADQATSINKTASAVEQMSQAIEGVAKGAQEQSQSIAKASNVTDQINHAIQQVAGNAAAVSDGSTAASEAAQKGAMTVEQTLNGMQSIKTKVGISADKVQEMGKRSEEIGRIVETIEDIASQTNLLALNAAIEAARAGEHGKGFAVVADEVRKLAERSSLATKEIGDLIGGILTTVSEAVKAMDEGSKEIERGLENANAAGTALTDILAAAEAVNRQAVQASEASEKMRAASEELVSAVDSVSAVIEENTASTEEMAANSTEVTQAIESIASVSQENSASIEEVSASAEEMSAQVEEVTASAQSLAEMAEALQQIVEKFKLAYE